MYNLDFTRVIKELDSWNLGVIEQDPKLFANALQGYIVSGSKLHTLSRDDIIVFAELEMDYDGKSTDPTVIVGKQKVSTTVEGLMKGGAKFFDAMQYLKLPPDERPAPHIHKRDQDGSEVSSFKVFNDKMTLNKYLFAVYFYIVIHGRPPAPSGGNMDQPIPKLVSIVLNIEGYMNEIVDYLASFALNKLNPNWVTEVNMDNISQEALTRLGLRVAGYRLVSIFNVIVPDKYTKENEKDKPSYLDDAIFVMRSFRKAGYCWDFHPATRDPDILRIYGHINKNAANLIIDAYKPETIDNLVKMKKIPFKPIYDPSFQDYKMYTRALEYRARKPIFGRINPKE